MAAATAALFNTENVTIAEPLSAPGHIFGARSVFASRVPRAAAAVPPEATLLSVPPLSDAGPFFLDPGGSSSSSGGVARASSGLPPVGSSGRRTKRFVAGSRLAKARQAALARASAQDPPRRDEETWAREVAELKGRLAAADEDKAAMKVKLIKSEREASKLQKLVGDVLVEQQPEGMAKEFRKIGTLREQVRTLRESIEARDRELKALQADAKVATARKLKDEVVAYQQEVSRLRVQLEERTAEANENARILKLARQKLAKHTQRTVLKTRRQTERVVAARHSADLDALATQSKLLKRELKNMQNKDWVMECARLEGMLQEAFQIVKHAEAQRAESIAQQEEMRAAVMENEHALEAEKAAHAEERKRAARAAKERDATISDNVTLSHRLKELEERMVSAEKAMLDAKGETAFAETQLRKIRRDGVHKLQMRKLARAVVVWARETESAKLVRAGKHQEEKLLREKAAKDDALGILQGQFEGLQGDMAKRAEAAEEAAQRWEKEVEEWRARARSLEETLAAAVPAVTQEMATHMTPQRSSPGGEMLAQRKPSINSILADISDEQMTTWKELADATPISEPTSSPGGVVVQTEAAAPPPSPPAAVMPAATPTALAADSSWLQIAEQEADAELHLASTRIQARYRGNKTRAVLPPPRPVQVIDDTSWLQVAQEEATETPAPFVPGSAVPEADLQVVAQEMMVMCPEGMGSGSTLLLQLDDGRKLNVVVPEGVSPGEQFKVMVEPSAPAPESEPLGSGDLQQPEMAPGVATDGESNEDIAARHRSACKIQAVHRGRSSRRDTMQRRQAKADAAAEREQALVRAVTICQAIRRGNVWRKRVAYFEKWDKTSGEIEPMVPKRAREGEELSELPRAHLIIGEHYTPLGLRLARQLFLVFDRDHDDRLSVDELRTLNEATMTDESERLKDEMLQELLLLFDSDSAGLTFGGFLDLYRMEDMDLATDCYTQRLTHGRNIEGIPALLPHMSLLPSFDRTEPR